MWVTKRSLYVVADLMVVDDRVPPSGSRRSRPRCKQCDSPLSYLVAERVIRGREDLRLVAEAYCKYCTGPPTLVNESTPIDSADLVRIRL